MTTKEQIKAIIKQYADKGKKMYSEAIDSKGSRYNMGFWDGYECCAKGLLRELEDMQEEHEYLEEETTYCAFSTSRYTDKERKALCKGCEEECRFNKKEDSVNNGLDLGCGVIWKDEKPVSGDDENALNSVAITFLQEQQIVPNFYADIIMKAVKRGANWQKEQMLAKAVDAVVKIDAGGYPYVDRTIELYDYDKDIPLAKCGDKVKILVIKED